MANQAPYPQGPYPLPQKKRMSTCLIVLLVSAILAVPLVIVMASLAFYGFRRYLASAKTAEAKNTIGAVSRAAVAAYEREVMVGDRVTHKLCGSAIAVPAKVPSAAKYQPSSAAGVDFQSGTEDQGWTCLKFSVRYPMYYQYHYHQGSGFLVPSTAPGPDGFEAAARGDIDGDGVFSTFARTGKVVGGNVVMATEMFIEQEFE